MKNKLNLNIGLPLKETLELRNMIIVVTPVFHVFQYYNHVFWNQFFYKL